MDSTADAIVYATAYISCREGNEDADLALEHIRAYLSHATPEEEEALAAAAERAVREEQSLRHPQREMIEFLQSWMEFMFGRDWDGNQRG